MSEGGRLDNPALQFTASNGVTARAVTTALPVLSISPKTVFAGIPNRMRNVLRSLSLNTGTHTIFYQVVYNGTLSGRLLYKPTQIQE